MGLDRLGCHDDRRPQEIGSEAVPQIILRSQGQMLYSKILFALLNRKQDVIIQNSAAGQNINGLVRPADVIEVVDQAAELS
jgi:hypothetical protein